MTPETILFAREIREVQSRLRAFSSLQTTQVGRTLAGQIVDFLDLAKVPSMSEIEALESLVEQYSVSAVGRTAIEASGDVHLLEDVRTLIGGIKQKVAPIALSNVILALLLRDATTARVKVSELDEDALDWAIAISLGYRPIYPGFPAAMLRDPNGKLAHVTELAEIFSGKWALDVIDRDRMHICPVVLDGRPTIQAWLDGADRHAEGCYGPNTLIALKRCFVTSRMGDVIDVPVQLAMRQGEAWVHEESRERQR